MAANMGNQVNGAIAMQRSERLRELGEQMSIDYHSQFVDKEIEVLVERVREGKATGYSRHYIPVEFDTTEDLQNQVVHLNATEASTTGLVAVL